MSKTLRHLGNFLRQRTARLRGRRGRRGFTTATFGVASVAILGMAAIGTDIGLWYLSFRNARSAADAAAMAGAASAAVHESDTVGLQAAHSIATANGFTDGVAGATVTVNIPPVSGAYAGVAGAVEVIVTQVQGRFLSRLVASGDPVVGVRAVAALVNAGQACVLALGGSGLQIGGNAIVASSACILASNRPGADSIRIFGSASVSAEGLSALGECDGCDSANLEIPAIQYAGAPATNPFAFLNDNFPLPQAPACAAQPNFSGANRTQTYQPTIPPTGLAAGATLTAYCSSVTLNANDRLNLEPGIYYFYNAGLRVNGGNLTCTNCVPGTSGVSIVFTGDPATIGTVRMDGNGTISLVAGPQYNTEYSGILFYRDIRATANLGNYQTIINGGSNTRLSGGMYFPSSDVTYNGNMATGPNPCTALVGQSISLSGNSSTSIDNSGCETYGTPLSQTRLVRLVE